MNKLLSYIRYIILTTSIFIAALIYFLVKNSGVAGVLADIRLGQIYAFLSVGFLYFALLVTPLYFVFPNFPYRALFLKSRRALGVSAFIFALLHSYFEYFKLLGGAEGITYLTGKYSLAVQFGIINLIILGLLAITSFNKAIKFFGPNWKVLHRFVYLAAVLIVFHALVLGSSFASLFSLTSIISLSAVAFLVMLESFRIESWIIRHFAIIPRYSVIGFIFVLLILGAMFLFNSNRVA